MMISFQEMDFDLNIIEQQKIVCSRYNTTFFSTPVDIKVGIAVNVAEGARPINGLRHPPQGDTSGWYIWGGEQLSSSPDFFMPLHAKHVLEWCPEIVKYLGLPPGWRFLFAKDYEDIWYDPTLLKVK
jgi:hypothetical protein